MWLKNFFKNLFFKVNLKEESLPEIEKDTEPIRGIDLRIDRSIQEICEVYIKSSSSTRGVLYILLLVSLLSLISVINTHKDNWTISRINSEQDTINKDESALIALMHKHEKIPDIKTNDKKMFAKKMDSIKHVYYLDSIRNSDKTNREVNERNNLIRNSIENSQTVRIPIIGNSFDINNLAIVSGISSIVLLVVVRFTLSREKNNLRIAFNSITERYNGCNIEDDLKHEILQKVKKQKFNEDNLCESFNLKRRRYHYNLLSMNEIFNIPELGISNNVLQKTTTGKIVIGYMYSFVFLIYLGVFANDLTTIDQGYRVSHWQTIALCIISYVCLNFIARICDNCNYEKKYINNLFNNFRKNDYKYDKLKDLQAENADRIRIDLESTALRNLVIILFFILFYAIYFLIKKMVYDFIIILFLKDSGN